MSEDFTEKILIVTSASTAVELATGDLINQVTFGYYIQNSPEILGRIPANARENFMGKQITFNELSLLFKAEEIPYKVGSKWKLKIHKNGTLSMVEVK